jgi:hypothetical protein
LRCTTGSVLDSPAMPRWSLTSIDSSIAIVASVAIGGSALSSNRRWRSASGAPIVRSSTTERSGAVPRPSHGASPPPSTRSQWASRLRSVVSSRAEARCSGCTAEPSSAGAIVPNPTSTTKSMSGRNHGVSIRSSQCRSARAGRLPM